MTFVSDVIPMLDASMEDVNVILVGKEMDMFVISLIDFSNNIYFSNVKMLMSAPVLVLVGKMLHAKTQLDPIIVSAMLDSSLLLLDAEIWMNVLKD